MEIYPSCFRDLVETFSRLPGLGKRASQRIAMHIMARPADETALMADTISNLRLRVQICPECGCLAQDEVCPICSDPSRDHRILCVVEKLQDAASIEGTNDFRGLFHVLWGRLDPLNGMGPEKLRLSNLEERVRSLGIEEIIVATGPDVQGDATAILISTLLEEVPVKVTRPAVGIPVGTDVEYADPLTLTRALRARRDL
ncbi:MAG: recombination protein RecR [Candidatus Wallbacteria bacterium HGW-Wallbacteria-1]|jgi:recombination protein RecR|uniref:Recombination protein RecR n=1 Tax=Candidatus Wallbacteria bacterium HGW-Wallbacteria-1 TaxID=2013854 RepID=A0A2N1PV01_9BACT|nr:MAG: recombination protein RecR [Candidatus Wallbacteria bacterium HGW-Wallbacteria-1]